MFEPLRAYEPGFNTDESVCSYFYFYSYTNVTRCTGCSTSIIKGGCGVCECTCIEGLKEELAWAIGGVLVI